MAKRESALGRGLDALLGGDSKKIEEVREKANGIIEIPINSIETNPYQPRSNFEEEALNDLANSIKEHGIIQPITVRQINENKYQIISGERRYRASKIAGLSSIPAYVRTANDQAMLELALIENIQRENLDAIEIAASYNRLIEECELTQESLAVRVGKKRATVTNYLRLLKLPAEIQLAIRDKQISMGHARALLNIEDAKLQKRLVKKIINDDWSVRQVEDAVRNASIQQTSTKIKKDKNAEVPENYNNLKNCLQKYFNNKVDIKPNNKGGGKITIAFDSDEELNGFIEKFDE